MLVGNRLKNYYLTFFGVHNLTSVLELKPIGFARTFKSNTLCLNTRPHVIARAIVFLIECIDQEGLQLITVYMTVLGTEI